MWTMHKTKIQNSPTLLSTPRAGGMITAVKISKDIDLRRGLRIGSLSAKL